jgi:hypothetical protein
MYFKLRRVNRGWQQGGQSTSPRGWHFCPRRSTHLFSDVFVLLAHRRFVRGITTDGGITIKLF